MRSKANGGSAGAWRALRGIGTAALLVTVTLALPKPASARLGPDTIALFPKEVGEFGYADMKKARSLKWFGQLQQQVLPQRFKEFEKFLAAAGLDPNSQVEELAWGLVADDMDAKQSAAGSSAVPTGEEIIGVALGSFNPDAVERYFKQQKLPTFKTRGYTLFPFGSGSGANDLFFVFFDSNKAAFGSRSKIDKMIEIRFGGEQGLLYNETVFPLINEANTGSTVWLVLNAAYTRLAVRQLAPEMEQFPEAAKLVTRLKNGIINVEVSNGVEAKVQIVCGSTEDANTMAQLLQAGLLYKRYQAGKENPDMATMLDSAKVSPAGDRLSVRMNVSDEQIAKLIQSNSFAVKM
ncbi:MAG TPA: hypothetical protein VOA78_15600 [Candidatus Dormibacteraeota bacterium]|nr:hypothetical protein [Candidatus Dormibacteraeota bacterium]